MLTYLAALVVLCLAAAWLTSALRRRRDRDAVRRRLDEITADSKRNADSLQAAVRRNDNKAASRHGQRKVRR